MMRRMNASDFYLLCLLCLLCISLVAAQRLPIHSEVVVAPHFTVSPSADHEVIQNNSETTTGSNVDRAVFQPEVLYRNDVEVLVSWKFDISRYGTRAPSVFIVEMAPGPYSEDFLEVHRIPVDVSQIKLTNSILEEQYLVHDLQPVTSYRLRVVPQYFNGPGIASEAVTFVTLRSAINYWEPIITRKSSKTGYRRGFSDPVVDRPHLSPGVENFEADARLEEHAFWQSDAPSRETPVLPSGRRGHSMTFIDGFVYMFGGRTNGYSCASTVIDTIDLGNDDSGRTIYPCVQMQSEVDEIWKLDVNTFEWSFINTTVFAKLNPDYVPGGSMKISPEPREQHSAALVAGNLFVFGGKSRLHAADKFGVPILTNKTDVVYNDLWMLEIEHATVATFTWQNFTVRYQDSANAQDDLVVPSKKPDLNDNYISQHKRNVFPINTRAILTRHKNKYNTSEGNSPRTSQCIEDVTIRVKIRHPCADQLRVSLLGPGPHTGSPNYFPVDDSLEIRLMTNVHTNSTNCVGGVHEFTFNDKFQDLPNIGGWNKFKGQFKSAGKLSEFTGSTIASNWSIVVEDVSMDTLEGVLLEWEVSFVSSPCFKSYVWRKLYAHDDTRQPVGRYAAKIIAYDGSLFVFGGRDRFDAVLEDLYRFDLSSKTWLMLTPVGFYNTAMDPAASFGANFIMTSWGLVRFGGYYRQRYMSNIYSTTGQGVRNNRFLYEHAQDRNTKYYNQFTNQYDNTMHTHDEQKGNVYENTVLAMNPVSLRWESVNVSLTYHAHLDSVNSYHYNDAENKDYSMYKTLLSDMFTQKEPAGRYLSAAAFIPASAMQWHSRFNDRMLYDQNVASYQANYQNNVADSIIVFGGFDAATGSVIDGSSGGYLSDTWVLRLNQYSTAHMHRSQTQYRTEHCQWRSSVTAQQSFQTVSCLSSQPATSCRFRDLMMLVWCSQHNQTLA